VEFEADVKTADVGAKQTWEKKREDLLEIAVATCHTVTVLNGGKKTAGKEPELVGNAVEREMVQYANVQMREMRVGKHTHVVYYPKAGSTASAGGSSSLNLSENSSAKKEIASAEDAGGAGSGEGAAVAVDELEGHSPLPDLHTIPEEPRSTTAPKSMSQSATKQQSQDFQKALPDGSAPLFQTLRAFEFDQTSQLQSVVVEQFPEPMQTAKGSSALNASQKFVFVKGSYEKVKAICKPWTLPSDYDEQTKYCAQNGFYVLAVAYREMSFVQDRTELQEGYARSDLEKDATFLGLLYFKNELKPCSAPAIEKLKDGNVKPVMITGDNGWTGVHVAEKCGIVPEDVEQFFVAHVSDKHGLMWIRADIGGGSGGLSDSNSDGGMSNLDTPASSMKGGSGLKRRQLGFMDPPTSRGPSSDLLSRASSAASILTCQVDQSLSEGEAKKLFDLLGYAEQSSLTDALNPSESSQALGGKMNYGTLGDVEAGNEEQKPLLRKSSNSGPSRSPDQGPSEGPKRRSGGSPDQYPAVNNCTPPSSQPLSQTNSDTSSTTRAIQNFRRESVGFAVTQSALNYLRENDPKLIETIFDRVLVWARMTPKGKIDIVQKWQKAGTGNVVGMCGDGGNDCGALKAADVGLALSESDASIVSPFSSPAGSIGAVEEVIREGRACLTNSVACYKFYLLFGLSFAMVKSLVISGPGNIYFSEMMFLLLDSVFASPLVYALAASRPCEELLPRTPTARLVGWNTMSHVFSLFFLNLVFFYLLLLGYLREGWLFGGASWYEICDPLKMQTELAGWAQRVNFESGIGQTFLVWCICSSAIGMSVAGKFREPVYQNKVLVGMVVGLCGVYQLWASCTWGNHMSTLIRMNTSNKSSWHHEFPLGLDLFMGGSQGHEQFGMGMWMEPVLWEDAAGYFGHRFSTGKKAIRGTSDPVVTADAAKAALGNGPVNIPAEEVPFVINLDENWSLMRDHAEYAKHATESAAAAEKFFLAKVSETGGSLVLSEEEVDDSSKTLTMQTESHRILHGSGITASFDVRRSLKADKKSVQSYVLEATFASPKIDTVSTEKLENYCQDLARSSWTMGRQWNAKTGTYDEDNKNYRFYAWYAAYDHENKKCYLVPRHDLTRQTAAGPEHFNYVRHDGGKRGDSGKTDLVTMENDIAQLFTSGRPGKRSNAVLHPYVATSSSSSQTPVRVWYLNRHNVPGWENSTEKDTSGPSWTWNLGFVGYLFLLAILTIGFSDYCIYGGGADRVRMWYMGK
jgi:magnesium-transporting ATPase (P-type)